MTNPSDEAMKRAAELSKAFSMLNWASSTTCETATRLIALAIDKAVEEALAQPELMLEPFAKLAKWADKHGMDDDAVIHVSAHSCRNARSAIRTRKQEDDR